MPASQLRQTDSHLLDAIDSLFYYCLERDVSDLHFEPRPHQRILRLRQQDLLFPYQHISSETIQKIMQRIKVLAKLDITETRFPQEASLLWQPSNLNHQIACRISTCPVYYGEKMVVRLLSAPRLDDSWSDLGLNASQVIIMDKLLQAHHGLILVNGPTGSGKTTTLYKMLKYLNNGQRNIVSIEDPIEIPYPEINQIELQPHLGFSIPKVLRTVLRQDPDVILIGEIRDIETAKLAIEASQTGHLILSSLHTSSCFESLQRLRQLQVGVSDLLNNLRGLIAQRLIRLSCGNCQTGCPQCLDGYRSRQGLFEMLIVDERLEDAFLKNDVKTFKKAISPSIEEQAFRLYEEKKTHYEELIRVIGH